MVRPQATLAGGRLHQQWVANPRRCHRFYAKRCFLGLAENLAKHMVTVKDSTFADILLFLDAADAHGKGILTVIAGASVTAPGDKDAVDASRHNVSYEARLLKRLYLKLRENM